MEWPRGLQKAMEQRGTLIGRSTHPQLKLSPGEDNGSRRGDLMVERQGSTGQALIVSETPVLTVTSDTYTAQPPYTLTTPGPPPLGCVDENPRILSVEYCL